MAANVFELIIKGDLETSSVLDSYPVQNGEFRDWVFRASLGYDVPEIWTAYGFDNINTVNFSAVPLLLFNEDFTEPFYNTISSADASVHASIYEAQGWNFINGSLINNGLTVNGSSDVEDTTTTGYNFYNATTGELAPDFHLYTVPSVGATPVRASLWTSYNLSTPVGTHPNQVGFVDNDKDYLIGTSFAGATALSHDSRVNEGSLRVHNAYGDGSTYVDAVFTSLVGGVGDKRVLFQANAFTVNFYYNFGFFGGLGVDFRDAINHVEYENDISVFGKLHFEGVEDSIFAPIDVINSSPTSRRLQPPQVVSFENVFPNHSIGKNVDLRLKLNFTSPKPQVLPELYNNGNVITTNTFNGGVYNTFSDITTSAVQFTVNSGVLSGTVYNKFYLKDPVASDNLSSSTTDYLKPIAVISTGSNSFMRISCNNANSPGLSVRKARCRMSLGRLKTYNLAFNIGQSKGQIKIVVNAINSDESIVEEITSKNIPVKEVFTANGGTAIYNLKFNTNDTNTIYAIDISVQKSSGQDEARLDVNYVRMSACLITTASAGLMKDSNGDFESSGFGVGIEGSLETDIPLIVTSHPILKIPYKWVKYESNSPHYSIQKLTDGAIFDSSDENIYDSVSLMLPYHNANFEYDNGESLNNESTAKILATEVVPKDADGFYEDNYVDVRISMVVGSNNLNLFFDEDSIDLLPALNFVLSELEIYDASKNFVSQNSADDIRFYSETPAITNNVAPPQAVQIDPIDENLVGQSVTIDYKVNSLSGGDSLVVDFGEGTPIHRITSAGTSSFSLVAGGTNLRMRRETAEEKGSALATLDCVVEYMKVSTIVTDSRKTIITKYGDTSESNASLPYVGAYDSAVRMSKRDTSNNQLVPLVADKTVELRIGVSPSEQLITAINSGQYETLRFDILIPLMATGNTIDLTQNLTTNSGYDTQTFNAASFSAQSVQYDISSLSNHVGVRAVRLLLNGLATNNLDAIIVYFRAILISSTTSGKEKVTIDLFEDFEVPLNVSIKDFKDLETTSSSFSKTIEIPATASNKLAFNFENELNSLSNKYSVSELSNGSKAVKFNLKAEGLPIFDGYANLLGSNLDENGYESLEINLTSGNANWAELLKDIDLKYISSDKYPITSDSLVNSPYTISAQDEIVFPLVDNGKWKVRDSENPDATSVGWGNVKAAFNLQVLFFKIFGLIGYKIKSDFFSQTIEYSDEFSSEFNAMNSKLIAIAPSLSKPDSFIDKTNFDASFDYSLETGAGYHKQNSAFYDTTPSYQASERPHALLDEYLGISNTVKFGYYIDWAYIRFNKINLDKQGIHSYDAISATDVINGVNLTDASDANRYKLKGNTIAAGDSKSFIEVSKSDYYDIDVEINFDFIPSNPNGLLTGMTQAAASSGVLITNQDVKITVLLVDEEVGDNEIYKTNNGLAFEAFDLFDENSVVLESSSYTNTRVILSRNQFLEEGKRYNVIVLNGFSQAAQHSAAYDSTDFYFKTGFIVNELDLRMKASKSIAPMEGKYSVIYTDVAAPTVSYLELLPEIKAIEFISDLTKMFNLIWTTNELTKEIQVEPFSDFYDFEGENFGFKDLTNKSLITRIENNSIVNQDLEYSMNGDSSDYSLKTYSGVLFGDKVVSLSEEGLFNVSNPQKKESKGVSLNVFSALSMGFAKFIARTQEGAISHQMYPASEEIKTTSLWLPRIWSEPDSTLEPVIPEQKPNANNSHEYKLAFLNGITPANSVFSEFSNLNNAEEVLDAVELEDYTTIHYSLEESFVRNTYFNSFGQVSGLFRYNETPAPFYVGASSYFPFNNDTPSALFSDSGAALNQGANSLYNTYHKKLIDMLIMRDKVITAEIMLSSEDVRSINFKQLIKIENELYIINKIKDFNFSGEPTEVELLLVTKTGTNY